MPPKVKFTRDEIIAVALELVRERGIASITARALAKNPNVLFLDEPTGALDEQTGPQVLNYICNLQKKYHFTIVMVTHNQNIAEMANTVIKMNSGTIIDIYKNESQKTAYEIDW